MLEYPENQDTGRGTYQLPEKHAEVAEWQTRRTQKATVKQQKPL
jgi:hypothetical protein